MERRGDQAVGGTEGGRMPFLVRFLLLHAAVGFGIATLAMAALLWTDFGGIATLLTRADGYPLPALLLWFFLGLTFGSVQMGAAFMLKTGRRGDDDDGRGGGRRMPVGRLAPVRVAAPAVRPGRR